MENISLSIKRPKSPIKDNAMNALERPSSQTSTQQEVYQYPPQEKDLRKNKNQQNKGPNEKVVEVPLQKQLNLKA